MSGERQRQRARDVVHVTAREVHAAYQVIRAVRGAGRITFALTDKGTRLALPRELIVLLERVVRGMLLGRSVRIEPLPEQLTTTQAAGLLGISRPTLMKRVKEGRLPAVKVGSHHRLLTDDVLNARRHAEENERRRAAALLRRPHRQV